MKRERESEIERERDIEENIQIRERDCVFQEREKE